MSNGKLIISLDLELMWGVRDHRSAAEYGDAVLGGRAALPSILSMFQNYGIRATWATVGLLFARSRTEMLDYFPTVKPDYVDTRLSPHETIKSEIGDTEDTDPLHFGRSLVDRIADTEGQEIATHTYTHYYCLEKGQCLESFAADISAAKNIATAAGHNLRSIVFPRNQMTDAHVSVCVEQGILIYRGNPEGFANRPRSQEQLNLLIRGTRLVDSVFPIFGRPSQSQSRFSVGSIDVKASRFLRPWSEKFPQISKLQHRHVISEMRYVAKHGGQYHLWWHPHNMGRNTLANLAQLESVLKEYKTLQVDYGMESANMLDIAESTSAHDLASSI